MTTEAQLLLKMLRVQALLETAKPMTWVLISPDGRVYQGTQREVARVLLQNIDLTTLFKDVP